MEASSKGLKIKLTFEHPEVISANKTAPQVVQVRATFSDFEPGWDDNGILFQKKLPRQKVVELSVAEVEAVLNV